MIAGLPFCDNDPEIDREHTNAKMKFFEYNNTSPDQNQRLDEIMRSLLGSAGKNVHIEQPFRCDLGYNISVGDGFFANMGCVMLDVCPIIIGDHVLLGPNVSMFTAGHPVHPESRATCYECGKKIVIGNNVWIGGCAVINPGVTIGDAAVIGSGSVVTHDIPGGVVAAGNPCRVLRKITEADKQAFDEILHRSGIEL